VSTSWVLPIGLYTRLVFEREIRLFGRRLKRIAWGWSDIDVTNISYMTIMKQYSRAKWEQYGKEKPGIKSYFAIQMNRSEYVNVSAF